MTLEEGQAWIEAHVQPCQGRTFALQETLGKILAQAVFATTDQPPFPRSPLDGYAVRSRDIALATKETPATLRVIGKVCAGETTGVSVGEKEAYRIMTGAPIPLGADCVVRQEATDLGEGQVEIYQTVGAFENYCFQGEDFKKGTLLLAQGIKMDSTAIAIGAGNGRTSLQVYAPRCLVINTGDELAEPQAPLGAGKIYDMNGAYLQARLGELGVQEVTQTMVGDGAEQLEELLCSAKGKYEFVITTGGVSVGERDMVPYVIEKIGATTLFHGLQLKPGSPVMFSVYEGLPILSLSGNPFAVMATFELLGRVVLGRLCGKGLMYERGKARLGTKFDKASPARRFVRGRYEQGIVVLPKGHASGQMASSLGCNCLVDIHSPNQGLTVGEEVDIIFMK